MCWWTFQRLHWCARACLCTSYPCFETKKVLDLIITNAEEVVFAELAYR